MTASSVRSRSVTILLSALLAIAISGLLPALVQAQGRANHSATLTYRTKRGDTLRLIAAEFYGDRRHAVFIAVENKLELKPLNQETPLRPGLRLRIPTDQHVTTAIGDTLESLATTHLGDARRAQFLAGFNEVAQLELPPQQPLAAGQVLKVPIQLRHTVSPDDTLRSISTRYLGVPRHANLVRQYNFLNQNKIEPGTALVIPVHRVTVLPERLRKADNPARARAARERAALHNEMMSRTRSTLGSARVMWRVGEYEHIQRALSGIDIDYLFMSEAIEVSVLLGSAYVALDDHDSAVEIFRQLRSRVPGHTLDAYAVSPKIRAVWDRTAEIDNAPALNSAN